MMRNIRIRIRIHYDRRSNLNALFMLPLVFALILGYWAWGWIGAMAGRLVENDQSVLSTQTWSAPAPRSYYLTANNGFTGSTADTACDAGYHMASLWEILDPSHLRYNNALGYSRNDNGYGPPSASYGWVRTGYDSDLSGLSGSANCNVWNSSSGGAYGSVVMLPQNWINPANQDINVWTTTFRECNQGASVWCVANSVGKGVCAEPILIKEGEQATGDTSSFEDNINAYSCSVWDESGPEVLYGFILPTGSLYNVTVSLSNMTTDLDVFILSSSGCGNPGQCLAADSYGNEGAEARLVPPGSYYIAVDGFSGASGNYALDLTVTMIPNGIYLPKVLREVID